MAAGADDSVRRIVVGITGASGSIYGVRLLEVLQSVPDVQTHLIITPAGRATLAYETSYTAADVEALADVCYPAKELAAAISSGSFRTAGMVVAPCSVKTLAGIANSYDENLVIRAADVTLKERRRLTLLVRETPLTAIHLRLMTEVTAAGAIVLPPVPSFYHRPTSIQDVVDQTVGRVLDLYDVDCGLVRRWAGPRPRPSRTLHAAGQDAVAGSWEPGG